MRVTEYKVLTSNDSAGINQQVNTYIGEGWQPYGGLKVITDGISVLYVQVVVRDSLH
jgi:hypothetical protein